MNVEQASAAVRAEIESFTSSPAGERVRALTDEMAAAKAKGRDHSKLAAERDSAQSEHLAKVADLKEARKSARARARRDDQEKAAKMHAGKDMDALTSALGEVTNKIRALKAEKSAIRSAMNELNAADKADEFCSSASDAAKREAYARLKAELGE